MNLLSKKIQTTQNSKKKTKKIIKTEQKKNIIKKENNIQNSNQKIFSHLNKFKNTSNCSDNSGRKKSKTSMSPSLKNLILKAKGVSDCRKNKIKS